jgi:hypothetical protein
MSYNQTRESASDYGMDKAIAAAEREEDNE